MPETAQRRLVKSPPELWSEISDAQSLARRLSALGEVRITRIEPETTVAWEGASIRGTVELEASGWGTQVRLTAEREAVTATAAQNTEPFDSSAVAVASSRIDDEPEPESALEPTEQTCADAEATGTDIPPPALSPAPREDGFLARLRGWWQSGRWDARAPEDPVPGSQHAAAETPASRVEPQPAATEAAGSKHPAAEAPAIRAESQPPAAPGPARPPAGAETPADRAELQPPHAETDHAGEPNGDAALRDPELEGMLVQILDDLGAAHHRPFSRA